MTLFHVKDKEAEDKLLEDLRKQVKRHLDKCYNPKTDIYEIDTPMFEIALILGIL